MYGFKAVLKSDIFSYSMPEITTYNMAITHENTGQILHSSTFQHYSHDAAVEIFKDYEARMMDSNKILALLMLDICKTLDMEFDFSQGIDVFFEKTVKHTNVDALRRIAEITEDDEFRTMIESEIKTRGEIKNDRNNRSEKHGVRRETSVSSGRGTNEVAYDGFA